MPFCAHHRSTCEQAEATAGNPLDSCSRDSKPEQTRGCSCTPAGLQSGLRRSVCVGADLGTDGRVGRITVSETEVTALCLTMMEQRQWCLFSLLRRHPTAAATSRSSIASGSMYVRPCAVSAAAIAQRNRGCDFGRCHC